MLAHLRRYAVSPTMSNEETGDGECEQFCSGVSPRFVNNNQGDAAKKAWVQQRSPLRDQIDRVLLMHCCVRGMQASGSSFSTRLIPQKSKECFLQGPESEVLYVFPQRDFQAAAESFNAIH